MRSSVGSARISPFVLLLLACVVVGGCNGDRSATDSAPKATEVAVGRNDAVVEAFCGNCHRMPDPGSFSKEDWRAEVLRGYGFYFASGRTDLKEPVQAEAIEYFISRAPEKLELPVASEVDLALYDQFRQQEIRIEGIDNVAVSFIDVIQLEDPWGRCLLVSDMRNGNVILIPCSADGQLGTPYVVGQVANPAGVAVGDWDGDGWQDLVVADLGSFLPADTKNGAVACFRRLPDDANGGFEKHVLHQGMGRVATVDLADFDRDGNTDLLVGEFGWHDTGSITLLRRIAKDNPWGELAATILDPRPGTIHLPVVDLNEDGAPDFIALLSQHYEQILAFINDGQGKFTTKEIFAAPDPSYGSSGIELVDVNGDGRLDILYTNGDSFDSFTLKSFHAVRWFENQGDLQFKEHPLGKMPGAHRALFADIDGDQAGDIVASAFLPKDLIKATASIAPESLVFWRRSEENRFEKHVLERGKSTHAAMELADLDGDGCSEIIVGHFGDGEQDGLPALTIWWSPKRE